MKIFFRKKTKDKRKKRSPKGRGLVRCRRKKNRRLDRCRIESVRLKIRQFLRTDFGARTIGEPSSKFGECLAAQSQFDSDHGVSVSTPTSCQSVTFCATAFCVLLYFVFLRKKINSAFRHRRGDVYAKLRCANDGTTALPQINR